MKAATFDVPIYCCQVLVAAGGTPEEAKTVIEEFTAWEIDGVPGGTAFTHANGTKIAMWFSLPMDDSTIVHECYHATQRVWEAIQEDQPGEENNAYLLDWLFSKVRVLLREGN